MRDRVRRACFRTRALLNSAIILAIALAAYFLWGKAGSARPAWSKTTRLVYVLTAAALLTINVWFAVAHRADTDTMRSGFYCLGWPVPPWSRLLVDPESYGSGFIEYADVYNGLTIFTAPLLLAVGSETVFRRRDKRDGMTGVRRGEGA